MASEEGFPMWVLGVILIIVGSLGNNLGNNLVSLDHENRRKFEKLQQDKLKEEKINNDVEMNQNNENSKNDSPNNENCMDQTKLNSNSSDNLVVVNTNDKENNESINYNRLSSVETDNDTQVESVGGSSSKKVLLNSTTLESSSQEAKEVVNTTATEEEPKFTSYRITGTVIFILGNLFTFGAFGFGAQSLLASLESIQFVSNLFFVKYVHHLPVTWRMIIATLSIVAGNVMVVIFAEHAAVLFTSHDMIYLYQTNTAYWAYLGFALIIFVVTNGVYQYYFHSRYIKRLPLLWQHNFLEPFCYACSAAIVGTQAVLNSKCMAMLIQVSARGQFNEFAFWYIWMIFATWILMVAYWINRIDTGLKYYPPLFIIPVMQVFFVFFAILCGGIYFKEFDYFTTSQWIGFSFGVAMILGGVYGLAPTDMILVVPDLDENQVINKDEAAKVEINNQNNSNKLVPYNSADVEDNNTEDRIPLFEVKQKPIPENPEVQE